MLIRELINSEKQGVTESINVQHGKVYNKKGRLMGTWDGKTFTMDPNLEKSLIDTDGEEFVTHTKQMYQSALSKQTAPAAPSKQTAPAAPSEDRIKYYANELEKYDRQSGEPVKSRQEYYVLARDMLSHMQGVKEDAYQEDALEVIEEISEHLMEARSASRLLNHRYDDGWLDDKVSSLRAHIAQAVTMCEHIHAHMTDTGEE